MHRRNAPARDASTKDDGVHGLAVCIPGNAVYLVNAEAGSKARSAIRGILRADVLKVTVHLKAQLRVWRRAWPDAQLTRAIDLRVAHSLVESRDPKKMVPSHEGMFALEYVRSWMESFARDVYKMAAASLSGGVARGLQASPDPDRLPNPEQWSAMLLAGNVKAVWTRLSRECPRWTEAPTLAVRQLTPDEILAPVGTSTEAWATLLPVEMPLVGVLVDMEERGVLVDVQELERQQRCAETAKVSLMSRLCELVSIDVNEAMLTNHEELGRLLFDGQRGLGIDATGVDRGREGQPRVNEAALKLIVGRHACVPVIMQWRKLDTFQGFMRSLAAFAPHTTEALPCVRVRGTFLQANGENGRIHMDKPNLMNLPKDIAYGGDAVGAASSRRCIVAPPGCVLVAADWRSMELRLLAHLSGDPTLIKLLTGEADVFDELAKLLQTPRDTAKQALYGVVYGMTPVGLADALNVPRAHAEDVHSSLWEKMGTLRKWKRQVEEAAV